VIAQRAGAPESTVRRRLSWLLDRGQVRVRAVVDPALLGLTVDADLRLQVPPDRLDAVGRALAAHPAVHGAMATTGMASLFVAVWPRDLDHLYEFVSRDLAALGVTAARTLIVGDVHQRPPGW
jgi:DNA-binding Lrp family transcriptional regulator